MPQTAGVLKPAVAWTKVEVLTSYQRLTGEIQMRVRLRETINDPETVLPPPQRQRRAAAPGRGAAQRRA